MGLDERIVRRLRLRAANEADVLRATTLFEDALRTASLPDAGARWVFVRRLALGRIEAASSQALALLLERGIETLRGSCLHGGEATARDMPAVWFRDALDAHLQLALRIAHNLPTDAWYWPLAVPDWRPGSATPQALRNIALSLGRRAEAPSALPAWTAALVAAGHAAQLHASLRSADVPVLLRAAGLSEGALVATVDDVADLLSGVTGASPASRLRATDASRPGADAADSRVRLLAALLQRARPLAGLARNSSRPGVAQPSRTEPGRPGMPEFASASAQAAPVSLVRTKALRTPRKPEADAATTPANPPAANSVCRPARARRTQSTPLSTTCPDAVPVGAGARPSAAAGLLFLIGIFIRLGYTAWLEAQPEWAPFDPLRRSLALAARRLGVAEDDPVWPLLDLPARPGRVPACFVAPAAWQRGLGTGSGPLLRAGTARGGTLYDASGRLLLGAWRGEMPIALRPPIADAQAFPPPRSRGPRADEFPDLLAQAWLIAARRWLRRNVGIGLTELVCRPGSLLATPTHVDLVFDLNQADLRLRRNGLDLDPGWLPCFGRVIAFHYLRPEERW
ncbi:hypothetical protein [Niveibacterium sp. SC-1]|uniref:hypothetical protein n=1 Tax=Niveibacterium sp. SC-1 TaxID=3135646 RepID=UPI00311FD6B9